MTDIETTRYVTLAELLNWDVILQRIFGSPNYGVYCNHERLKAACLVIALESRIYDAKDLIEAWKDNYPLQLFSGYPYRQTDFPIPEEALEDFLAENLEKSEFKDYLRGEVRLAESGGGKRNSPKEQSAIPENMAMSGAMTGFFSPFEDRDEIYERYNPF